MNRFRHLACAWAGAAIAVFGVPAGSASAAPYVIQASGQKLEGTAIRGTKDGEIVLTTADGQLTFPKGTKAYADPPADFPKATQAVEKGQFDEAIRMLSKIVEDYRFLEWDNKARRLLAAAYLGKNDAKSALAVYEDLFKVLPDSRKDEDIGDGYLRAMAGVGDPSKLAPLLDESIATGPRKAAALAQVLRGNAKMGKGDIEGALYDFLRTVEFFREEASVQPEALYRVGECFDKMNDPRGADYFARVLKEYPQSQFAAKVRARSVPTGSGR